MSISRLFFLTGLILISHLAFAQDTKNESIAQDTTLIKPDLIPAIEFTNELPDATKEIKGINSVIIPDSVLHENKIRLDTFLLKFEEFQKNQLETDTGKAEQIRLENLTYLWNQQKDELAPLSNDFNKIKSKLVDQRQSLDDILNTWKLSLEATSEKEIPENVKDLVNSFLTEIELIKDTITQKNDFVYAQLERITSTNIVINDNISNIETKLGKITEVLLLTKGPSLFKAIKERNNIEKVPGSYPNTFKDIQVPVLRYITDHTNLLIIIGFLFIVLLIIIMVLRKKLVFEKYKKLELQKIYAALAFLTRPLASALLITLLISTIVFADAPHIFITVIFILLVLPVLIIIPAITIKELNIYIYSFGFLYLFTLFIRLSLINPIGSHLIMIAISMVTLFGLITFLKKKILDKILLRPFSRWLFKLLFTLFGVILVISIFAIIFGYYSLGGFLLDGSIWSIYRFFLFYAAAALIIGFTEILFHSDFMQQINTIKKYTKQILQWLNSVIFVVIITLLLLDILTIFTIEQPVINFFTGLWEYEIPLGELHIQIGKILLFFITLWVAVLLSKIISAILEQDILKKLKLKRGMPRTISVMAKYGILTIGFMVAVAAAGLKLTSLTIVIGALGVGIGFGLQDVINNFISGLILLFERPIQIGDTIEVGQLWGKVKQIGIRSSVIVTFDGSEVIVPNGMLISQEVTNWTLSDNKRRLDVEVGVEYGSDLKQVIKILKKCATSHKEVMEDPPPSAWFTGFGDSSINFKLVFWFPAFDGGLGVKSEVALAVDKALKEAGITIPFPQQDLYIKEIKDKLPEKPSILKKTITKNSGEKNEEAKKPAAGKEKKSPPKK